MAKHKDETEQAKAPEEKPPEATAEPEPTFYSLADEQRKRSEEIQAKGVEAFKAEHDDRPESERGASTKQVPGTFHAKDERTLND